MDKPGKLLYKCQGCGQNVEVRARDVQSALLTILYDNHRFPGQSLHRDILHRHHNGGSLGDHFSIAMLIGGQEDHPVWGKGLEKVVDIQNDLNDILNLVIGQQVEPKPIRISLETIKLAPAAAYPAFADKNVRIWCGELGMWWRPDANGYTANIAEAGIWNFPDAFRDAYGCGPETQTAFEIVTTTYPEGHEQ